MNTIRFFAGLILSLACAFAQAQSYIPCAGQYVAMGTNCSQGVPVYNSYGQHIGWVGNTQYGSPVVVNQTTMVVQQGESLPAGCHYKSTSYGINAQIPVRINGMVALINPSFQKREAVCEVVQPPSRMVHHHAGQEGVRNDDVSYCPINKRNSVGTVVETITVVLHTRGDKQGECNRIAEGLQTGQIKVEDLELL